MSQRTYLRFVAILFSMQTVVVLFGLLFLMLTETYNRITVAVACAVPFLGLVTLGFWQWAKYVPDSGDGERVPSDGSGSVRNRS